VVLQQLVLHRQQLAQTERLGVRRRRGRGEVSVGGRMKRRRRKVLHVERNLLQSLVQVKLHLCGSSSE